MMDENYLIEQTNKIISELVYPKERLLKAYNYYNGLRDAELYAYLETNYGIGTPTSVEFIPLIRKHIDALVGEYLGNPILPKVSSKDTKTLNLISREKQLYINNKIFKYFTDKLKTLMINFIDGENIKDPLIEKELLELKEDLENNFESQYEIAALNVVEYIIQSKDTDLKTKLRQLILDLLISGYTYFKVKPSLSKQNVNIEVLSPLNTFTDEYLELPYIKNAQRSVVRKWLSKHLILSIYGKDLSKSDLDTLKDSWELDYENSATYVHSTNGYVRQGLEGLRADENIIPGQPTGPYNYKLIPVYEVEWIETDDDFVMQLYETIRIGESIYILKGKNENVYRNQDNPNLCNISLNGVCFLNRNSLPYSLVLACAGLLDKYDLLHFYRDNLIANSGTVGDWVDISLIPASFGSELTERILKFIAYKKTGLGFIDSTQEGRMANGLAPMNTIFNGYDDTIKAQTIQAFLMAIESVELTTSSITGVFRERLNGIEQRDAVTNVKQSANNSFIITKQYFQLMDLVTVEILMDSLNCGKKVYKKGLKGCIILGDKQRKIFTALPEYFTMTDYDIRINNSTETIQDIEALKSILPQLVSSQQIDPSIIIEAITTKSLTDLKIKIQKALKKQKEENNVLLQMLQLLQQSLQLLQQLQKELQQALSKIQTLNEAKIQLEKEKLAKDSELEWYKAKTDRNYKTESIEIGKKKVDLELQQLKDGNPYNDKINFQ